MGKKYTDVSCAVKVYGDDVVVKTGWSRRDIYRYFAKLGFKVGCEVGVKSGQNASKIFKSIPGVKLYLVEPFFDYSITDCRFGEKLHYSHRREAFSKLKKYDTEWIEDISENAASKIENESLDFVYIDGNHSYDFCMLDLILYSRKVRKGGIISGHDFSFRGVFAAVMDYVEFHKAYPLYLTETDYLPSWYFFKGE